MIQEWVCVCVCFQQYRRHVRGAPTVGHSLRMQDNASIARTLIAESGGGAAGDTPLILDEGEPTATGTRPTKDRGCHSRRVCCVSCPLTHTHTHTHKPTPATLVEVNHSEERLQTLPTANVRDESTVCESRVGGRNSWPSEGWLAHNLLPPHCER